MVIDYNILCLVKYTVECVCTLAVNKLNGAIVIDIVTVLVCGDVVAETSEKVLDNWDKLKRVEKSQETYSDTLKSVPAAFPVLL
jgi:hypothetical protein